MPYQLDIDSDQSSPVFKKGDSWRIILTNEDDERDCHIWYVIVRNIDKMVSFYDDDMNSLICCRKAKKYVGNKEGVKLLLKSRGRHFEVMLYSARPNANNRPPPPPPPPTPVSIPDHFIAEFMEMSLQLKKEHKCPCCFENITKENVHIPLCCHILCKKCNLIVKETTSKCPICRNTI